MTTNRDRHLPPVPAAGVSAGSIVSVADNLRHAGAAGERLAVFGAVPGINTSQTAIKLARLLADDSRVVLVGLASGDTAIRGISNEPSAPGLAELACGAATFGSIITKDKFSPLHLIAAGHGLVDRVGVLAAPGVVTSFNALARAYDHVVVDAGEAAGRGDRAYLRDCSERRAHHRHAVECLHDIGAGSPAGVRIW